MTECIYLLTMLIRGLSQVITQDEAQAVLDRVHEIELAVNNEKERETRYKTVRSCEPDSVIDLKVFTYQK